MLQSRLDLRPRTRTATVIGSVLAALAVWGFAIAINRMSYWSADADRVTLLFLYDDLFVRSVSIADWQMSECNFLFPDALLLFAALAVTSSSGAGFALYAAIYVALLVFFGYVVLSTVLRGRAARVLALGATAFGFAGLICAPSEDPAAALFPSVHGGIALLVAALLAICARGLTRGWRSWQLLLMAVSIALGELSDPLLAVQFGAPSVAAFVLLPALGYCAWRDVLKPLAAVTLGFAGGGLLQMAVVAFGVFKVADVQLNLSLSWRVVVALWRSLSLDFAAHISHYCLVLFTALLSAYVLKQARERRQLEPERVALERLQTFLAAFFLALLGAMLGAVLLTGHVGLPQRYLQPAWLLPPLFLGALFERFPKQRWGNGVPALLATLGVVLCLAPIAYAWRKQPRWNFDWRYSDGVACVDAFAERTGAKVGYAEYWRAKPLSARSKTGLRIYQSMVVGNRLEPYLWLNNGAWYREAPRPGGAERVLVFPQDLEPRKLRRLFGTPKAQTNCGPDYDDVWAY